MFNLDIYLVFILLATLAPGIACAGLWRFPDSRMGRSYDFSQKRENGYVAVVYSLLGTAWIIFSAVQSADIPEEFRGGTGFAYHFYVIFSWIFFLSYLKTVKRPVMPPTPICYTLPYSAWGVLGVGLILVSYFSATPAARASEILPTLCLMGGLVVFGPYLLRFSLRNGAAKLPFSGRQLTGDNLAYQQRLNSWMSFLSIAVCLLGAAAMTGISTRIGAALRQGQELDFQAQTQPVIFAIFAGLATILAVYTALQIRFVRRVRETTPQP